MTRPRPPGVRSLRSLRAYSLGASPRISCFSTATVRLDEAHTEAFRSNPDPLTVFDPQTKNELVQAGIPLLGSRRRRIALQGTSGIPFNQLPYQCFQEARKILIEDRELKLKQIQTERARIARLQATTPRDAGEEAYKQKRLRSMQTTLERLKILADINDPMVKKRFEDGLGSCLCFNLRFS